MTSPGHGNVAAKEGLAGHAVAVGQLRLAQVNGVWELQGNVNNNFNGTNGTNNGADFIISLQGYNGTALTPGVDVIL